MSIFPTSLTDKTTLVAWDKVLGYDSETPSNKNFSADAIADFAFTSKTSDDLSEWATNKYASTANIDAAWAVMNSDTSTAGMSFVIDEDNMVSDSATKVPTQQSVKAYVDNFIVPSATETTEGIVERATDAEVVTGTDTTRYVTPAQVFMNVSLSATTLTAWWTNGTFTTSSTQCTNWWFVSGSWSVYNWSWSARTCQLYIQYSLDNITWANAVEIYNWDPGNSPTFYSWAYYVKPWYYVRGYCFWSWSSATASIRLHIQQRN